uniref:Uncharacterized protein n=1 Tax=Anguilla anguilla TaxID=7936 RepID=A0A0E9PAJ3_ANGAN
MVGVKGTKRERQGELQKKLMNGDGYEGCGFHLY